MKLLNLKILPIALCIVVSVTAYGQKKDLPGYVIINGDTIKGTIEYGDWNRNPDRILFKDNDGNTHSYQPGEIEKFSVINDLYVSAELEIETSPFEESKLSQSPDLQFQAVNVFLRVLVEGRKNLFYYMDASNKIHFIIGAAGSYEDLVYKRYVAYTNGVPHMINSKRFIGQLTVYLSDCPDIQEKLHGIRYQKSALVKLFERYHTCTKSETEFAEEKKKVLFTPGIMGGISLSKIDFSATNSLSANDPMVETEFESSIDFSGGVFLDIILPRAKRIILSPELVYTRFKFAGENISNDNYRKTTFAVEAQYVKLNTIVGYKLPLRKMSLYVNGGVCLTKLLYSAVNSKESQTASTGNNPNAQHYDFVDLNTKLNIGSLVVGAGGVYKRISVEFRNERGIGFNAAGNNYISSPVNLYYALLKYRMK